MFADVADVMQLCSVSMRTQISSFSPYAFEDHEIFSRALSINFQEPGVHDPLARAGRVGEPRQLLLHAIAKNKER